MIFRNLILLFSLLLLSNCATGSAFLGPVFTGVKTGSIYQASLSYSTGKIMNHLIQDEINIENTLTNVKLNKSFSKMASNNRDPIIVSFYKVENIKFSEVLEPEPLP